MMMEAVRTSETSVENNFTYSSLMMEAVRTSETSVDNHFTRQYNPEDSSEHQLVIVILKFYSICLALQLSFATV
jgi:hypothetical protein